MHESARIAAVHKFISSDLIKIKMRVLGSNGVPDAYYAGPKRELWIEYKQERMPVRTTTLITPSLSALQRDWCTKRASFDPDSLWVVVFTLGGHFILKDPVDWGQGFIPGMHTPYRYRDLAREIDKHIR